MQKIIALVLLALISPLLIVIMLLLLFTTSCSPIFSQLRLGKDKKPFMIYKFRTMIKGADGLQSKYTVQNEADGPVFKIRDDPRYTKVGRFLAHSGLDELPQLVNIIKGEMAFVGPRPLPINEALKVPAKYALRFSTLPGLTSLWVVQGSHSLSFKRWMELDMEYIENRSIAVDIQIIGKTIWMLI